MATATWSATCVVVLLRESWILQAAASGTTRCTTPERQKQCKEDSPTKTQNKDTPQEPQKKSSSKTESKAQTQAPPRG